MFCSMSCIFLSTYWNFLWKKLFFSGFQYLSPSKICSGCSSVAPPKVCEAFMFIPCIKIGAISKIQASRNFTNWNWNCLKVGLGGRIGTKLRTTFENVKSKSTWNIPTARDARKFILEFEIIIWIRSPYKRHQRASQ